jgi:hypothetical protein
MRRRVDRPLACALLLGAAALGAACNALLGNEDATAPDTGSTDGGADSGFGADAASPDAPTTPVDGNGSSDGAGDATTPPDTFVPEAGDAAMAQDALVFADGGPELVWTDIDDPRAVAVDINNVYWIDATNVYQCPLGGCSAAATLLASGGGSFAGILTDGHYLYWTDEMRHMLAFCALSPKCEPSSFASATQPHGLAHDVSYLYVTHVSSGDIGQGPIDTFLTPAIMSTLVSALVAPRAVAVGGMGDVYWTHGVDAGGVAVCQLPLALGCSPMEAVATTTIPGELVADANNAYVTLPDENRVVSIDVSSYMPTTLATNQHHPTYLALDPKYVYWVDLDGLKYCPRATIPCTAPKLLTALPLQPGGIAVAAGFVYGALRAIHLDGTAATAGAIYRFAAPP